MDHPPLNSSPPTGNLCVDGAVFVAEVRFKANRTDGNISSRLRVVGGIRGEKHRMAEKIVDKKIRVWDLPVRLFHWTLVVLLVVSYFTGRAGGDWMKFHFWSGYAILTLLLFRIAWGLCRQHHRALLRFRQRSRGVPGLSARPAARPAHLRCRPQSGGRHHGRAAALRRAGAGGRGPVLCRHRHRHGHRPALRPDRRQVDRPLHALPQLLGERAPDPGRPARAGGRRSISCGNDRT